MASSSCEHLLLQLYHHVVLPRKVPREEDKGLANIEDDLAARLCKAVKSVIQHAPLDDHSSLDAMRLTLSSCRVLNANRMINSDVLLEELQQFSAKQALILHVTEQNAALLMYEHKNQDGSRVVVVEAFEAAASCERVLATETALQCDFPGQAVAIPHDVFHNSDFQRSLCAFLEQASIESIKLFAAVTQKAKSPIPEIRDTTHPKLVTELLMTILEAVGSIYNTKVLRKRVRDTVSFYKALKPWRRSPFYLVLRVAMQRHLCQSLGVGKGQMYYKIVMCIFMSDLLRHGQAVSPNEVTHHLRQKLGRRLAKLELDAERGPDSGKVLHRHVFRTLGLSLENTLRSANRFLELERDSHNRRTTRVIQPIQQFAAPEDLNLRLPRSGPALMRATDSRSDNSRTNTLSAEEMLRNYEKTIASRPFVAIMNTYLPLYMYEENVKGALRLSEWPDDSARCIYLARKIEAFMSTVKDAYHDYPEFTSRYLLAIMELWQAMDECARSCYPLLQEFHPGFEASMFDILELSTDDELNRLYVVQSYIRRRCEGWCGRGSKSIFAPPAEGSYAVRHYDHSSDATKLVRLRKRVEQDAAELFSKKEQEWLRMSDEYDQLMSESEDHVCPGFKTIETHKGPKQVHKAYCEKHKLKHDAKQLKITVFEYPLPSTEADIKAVMFELMCPEAFAAYRDATWLLRSSFAEPARATTKDVPLLRSYVGLCKYANTTPSRVTLGSSTKSHLDSHYATTDFPVRRQDILRSFGLKLTYYDGKDKCWTNEDTHSLAHFFPMKLPLHSPYCTFEALTEQWPTSNRVLATQTKCPAELNVHEYMAWQGLLVGTCSRWPSLLRELGATNLNFSTESTWAIVSKLCLQVGPTTSDDATRDVHILLRDTELCKKLFEQVNYRLEAISRNWREPVQLDSLITILLKIMQSNTESRIYDTAMHLLIKVRSITRTWYASLDLGNYECGSSPSVFGIWAAVLCKRTFYPLFEEATNVSSDDLRIFVIASIALQDCLVGRFDILPYNLRNAILRDLALAFKYRHEVSFAIDMDNRAVYTAIDSLWPISRECADDAIELRHTGDLSWVTMTLLTRHGRQHHVHYHTIRGTLLIDGQQLGILPPEYSRWPIIEELFGCHTLKTYPSTMPGMSYLISREMANGHWVHLTIRNGELLIRASHQGTVLQLCERNLFGNERQNDLASTLGKECFHWLNLHTRVLEIRQQDPWKFKKSNWQFDMKTGRATRNQGSTLVDPNSALAIKIAQNFYLFEHSYNITVYQPPKGPIRVELKRLELDFVVTRTGLLHCQQLGAVVAETRYQDVGTWYGLQSKLVFRSLHDYTQRSILLPLGPKTHKREGHYTSTVIKNTGHYLRFGVNPVLGRIECPAEPLLLYHRALWHALTSHFLLDSLTGRTGAEESLQYLRSGAYQPWVPLSADVCNVLLEIAKLSPERAYYPTSLKAMESVHWDISLTTDIQDDRYRSAVNNILQRNRALAKFSAAGATSDAPPDVPGDAHLEFRSLSRINANVSGRDQKYQSRDGRTEGKEHTNVTSMAQLLFEPPDHLVGSSQLASLLDNRPIIGGYTKRFDRVQFTDILEVDLGVEWGPLILTASNLSFDKRFEAMFLFSLLAFAAQAEMDLIRTIAAFFLFPDLKDVTLPQFESYIRFRPIQASDVQSLSDVISEAKVPPPNEEPVWIQKKHEIDSSQACRRLAESIHAQWPAEELDLTRLVEVPNALLGREEAIELVQPFWTQLVNNFIFTRHIEEVQTILLRQSTKARPPLTPRASLSLARPGLYPLRIRGGDLPTLPEILGRNLQASRCSKSLPKFHEPAFSSLATLPNGHTDARTVPVASGASFPTGLLRTVPVPPHARELEKLVVPFRTSASAVHKRYGAELEHSIEALYVHLTKPVIMREPFNPTRLSNDLLAAKGIYFSALEDIRHALSDRDVRGRWLRVAGLWPKMTTLALLTELRSTSGVNFGAGVKDALLRLGVAITNYQRLLRMQDAIAKQRQQQTSDEYDNPGHTNWSPNDHIDWLLLEIEGDMMLRPEQIEVALATISPASGQNSVLQLLMGKGKTSCILPMVALELANKSLFRVVVPRPLLLQSVQIMQSKLGGLLNREIMHIPFSRKTPTDKALMQAYSELHTHMQSQNGIMVALPEHLLSFRLSGLQQLCDGRFEEAELMIRTQERLDRDARDVLDECDILLAIRTQLIYPSGSQRTVDGHPSRWQTVQTLLGLILSHLDDLMLKFPSSIEIVRRIGFPLLYFLRKDAEDYLVEQLAYKICRGQTALLPVREFSQASQKDINEFISKPLVSSNVTERVLSMFGDQRQLVDIVLHLRGLFVHRILLSTLKKRWNVQYGLHPSRTPIAVPYHAKGVPSHSAEWGHPDVAIILTCLSFYYEGLDMAKFKRAFEQLGKADEPSIEYGLWVAEGVSGAFKNYNAINVEDGQQLHELHEQVKYKVCLIDFYLNSFVFPQHAKQFSKKLSASGSDLVLYNPNHPETVATTGFSGTNDSRHQLPMTIKQNDLPQLAHTNAEVLAYLLDTRNRQYVRMVDAYNRRLSETGFLEKLLNHSDGHWEHAKPLRVLIDAGAQILEHDNISLVKAWLKIDTRAAAAVFLDANHRVMVVFRKGICVPLVASPFAENLEGCLVYIDESHCRGTDLKLPPDIKAAVTLGPHLTKDALAQAAMRLRLLGTTQSVAFFSPPEVHQNILDLRSAAKARLDVPINSFDVLRWLLDQSCQAIEQLEPLYFNQIIGYLQRTQAKLDHPGCLNDASARDAYLAIVRSNELHSLSQLYEPKLSRRGAAFKVSDFAPILQPYVSEIVQRRKGFQDRGFAVQSAALEEVEQEREMEFEIECVREVQQPVHFRALKVVKLHRDIEDFASTGRLPADSDAFQPMFSALQKTALGIKNGTIKAAIKAARLWVSKQYGRAVSLQEPNDNFLRPCHWLLWSPSSEIGIILSPEEADALIPILHQTAPACHLIVYMAPVTRHMLQFNDLDYYAIPTLPASFKAPAWLKVELGIFAGRLYFEWDEYEELSTYLGMSLTDDVEVDRAQNTADKAFATRPLVFLHEWLAIRRKGQDFEHTPMGYITTGKPLSATHSFFSATNKASNETEPLPVARVADTIAINDDDSEDDEEHVKAHIFEQHDDAEGDIFHDAYEEVWDEADNIFFDEKEFVHVEDGDGNED